MNMLSVSDRYDTSAQEMIRRLEARKKAMAASKNSKAKKKKKKKRVSYDAREIPAQLMRVTHSMGAGQILVRANSRLQQLQMCLATGDYDLNELRAAIGHAKKMVKCAKKKLKNLREEEQIRDKGKKRNPSQSANRERIAKLRLERELGKLRRRHRGDEKKDMDEAKRCYERERANAERAERAMEAMSCGGEGGETAGDAGAVDAALDAPDVAPVDVGAVAATIDVCL